MVDALPSEPSVKKVVLDFESALWSAVKTVLPEAQRSEVVRLAD